MVIPLKIKLQINEIMKIRMIKDNILPNKMIQSEFILKVPNSSQNLDIKYGNEISISWNSNDARALDPK